MKPLQPIPTPAALRWREFRIRALPVAVFAVGLVATAMIWTRHVRPPTLVGEVEARRAHVVSIRPGTLAKLNVERFSTVRAGDQIAEILVSDPRYFESMLGVIKAEAEVLRLQLDPIVTSERSKVDFERLRLELLNQKVLLASAQMQVRYAEAEFNRLAALHEAQEGIASKSQYDLAQRDRDALRSEVNERAKLVAELEASLAQMRLSQQPTNATGLPEGWRVALELQEQRLKQALAEFGPVSLTAPIDGMVSTVYRRSGENVAAGEPIVTITSTRSERIVAYAVPPWTMEPRVGMSVEVRTRSGRREVGRGVITDVGGHLDVIASTLVSPQNQRTVSQVERQFAQLSGGGMPLPLGLPLAITIPASLHLLPGESVDLRLLNESEGETVSESAN